MKRFIPKLCTEIKYLLVLFFLSFVFHSCTAQLGHGKDFYGRKDSIRNELVFNNNQVFKDLINSQNIQITSLNKAFFIMQEEFRTCQLKLEKCKCK